MENTDKIDELIKEETLYFIEELYLKIKNKKSDDDEMISFTCLIQKVSKVVDGFFI